MESLEIVEENDDYVTVRIPLKKLSGVIIPLYTAQEVQSKPFRDISSWLEIQYENAIGRLPEPILKLIELFLDITFSHGWKKEYTSIGVICFQVHLEKMLYKWFLKEFPMFDRKEESE